jgi:hypothetical protein
MNLMDNGYIYIFIYVQHVYICLAFGVYVIVSMLEMLVFMAK